MEMTKCSQINDYTHNTGHDLITSNRTELQDSCQLRKSPACPVKPVLVLPERKSLIFAIYLKHREGFTLRQVPNYRGVQPASA